MCIAATSASRSTEPTKSRVSDCKPGSYTDKHTPQCEQKRTCARGERAHYEIAAKPYAAHAANHAVAPQTTSSHGSALFKFGLRSDAVA